MPVRGEEGLEARIARLEERLLARDRDFAELLTVVSGPPWERSLRGRVHVMEAEGRSAQLASQALAEAKAVQRETRQEIKEADSRRLSWRWKALGAITAAVVAIAPYVQMYYG